MRFRQDPKTLELVPMDEAAYMATHHIIPEIQPYQSMVDGSWITSRAKHHEHLRKHNMFEVGNETHYVRSTHDKDDGPKEIYRQRIMSMSYDQFKRAVKKECDFIEWNSRGLPRSN